MIAKTNKIKRSDNAQNTDKIKIVLYKLNKKWCY